MNPVLQKVVSHWCFVLFFFVFLALYEDPYTKTCVENKITCTCCLQALPFVDNRISLALYSILLIARS